MAGPDGDSEHSTPVPSEKSLDAPAGWVRRARIGLQTALFGYDFFISYRHADGARCAQSLHAGLQGKFDCFLDTLHYEAGHNLPRMQSHALRRARKLLVVVSPRAHAPPPRGTDWLLAEVKEFRYLAMARGAVPQIIPVGTHRTLSTESFPESKLLPEIPTPDRDHICVIDDAVERNAEVSPASLEKLINDFKQVRRRRVRQASIAIAVFAASAATVFGISAGVRELEAQKNVRLEQAFRVMARASAGAIAPDEAGGAGAAYAQSRRVLEDLGLDPIMARHGTFAERLHALAFEKLGELEGETGSLTVSADGDWILVVYDYQAPSGAPDMEDILDRPAFGVFHVPERKWTLKQPLQTTVGQFIYTARVAEFHPPEHVVVDVGDVGGVPQRESISLRTGASAGKVSVKQTPVAHANETPPEQRPKSVEARLGELLSKDRLFRVPPEDGIDMEYGPRLVAETQETSPDGRMSIVGTYEGKLMLVDRAIGMSRGELQTSSIFAAAFRPDSRKGYVATAGALLALDTAAPGVIELRAPLQSPPQTEKVLAATLADDGSVVALATTRRLLARNVLRGGWLLWDLPKPIEHVAALRVDTRRKRVDFISADDGTIVSADLSAPRQPPSVIARPGSPAPAVAWLDSESPLAWISGTTWHEQSVNVDSLPLPGGSGKPMRLRVSTSALSAAARGQFSSEQIHALAKVGDRILLFHGDDEFFGSGGSVVDEQLLTVPLNAPQGASNRVLFQSSTFRNGPDTDSEVTRVESVLPDPTSDAILVRAEFNDVYAIGPQDAPAKWESHQYVRRYTDGAHVYDIAISGQDTDRWLTVRHRSTGTSLKYLIPWSFNRDPTQAWVGPAGRHVMLADDVGDVLVLEVK